MNNILVITHPDDVFQDGFRLLLVDLNPEQTQIISDGLTGLDSLPTTMTYIWRNEDPTPWLFDKKHKSNLIIFNASAINQKIVGYMAAQSNAYYFESLRSLSAVNPRQIHNGDQCTAMLTDYIDNYRKNTDQ